MCCDGLNFCVPEAAGDGVIERDWEWDLDFSWERETESERERLKFELRFFFLVCCDGLNFVCLKLRWLTRMVSLKQTAFIELVFQSYKTSSLNSFSSLTKRVQWTRFARIETEFIELVFQSYKTSPMNSISGILGPTSDQCKIRKSSKKYSIL